MASSPCKKTRPLSAAASPRRHQGIPDEIIEDILARMPAKSVLRCRCLSRAWAATLSSDAFVDRHLDLANRHREVPRLCFLPRSAAQSTVSAWSPELGKGVFTPLMAVPHNSRNGMLHAVSRTCRGVLLLRATKARMYFLCNPSMGQIAALPDGRMADLPYPSSDYASYGLGYDARSRSHKVVRLLYHDRRPAGCDIYDVGASSAGHWRPAAAGAALPPERVRMNQMGVFVEGHVHWPTIGAGHEERIVSFSMADERFGNVTPPPGAAVVKFALAELAGCLCLISAPHCPKSNLESIDIWLMTGYATGSWAKHWHIDLTKLPPPPPEEVGNDFMFNDVTPLAIIDGGRRILFVSRECQVAAYCLAAGTLEDLVPGFRGRGSNGAHHHFLVPYEESLVPVGRPFEDILWSSPPARALSVALRRLPARTLGRLKLVCRSWRAMLESDRFATLHNARARATAATRPVPVAFLTPFGTATAPKFPVEFLELNLLTDSVVSLESCSGDDHGADRWNPPLSTTRVVCRAPCHGLVLLSDLNGKCLALCNPVTRAARRFVFPDHGGRHGCAGLGYDRSREEHVVVRLSYTSRCLETRAYAMECSLWPARDLHPRTLESRPPIPAAVDVAPVHVGGKMYWPREPRLGAATGDDFAILAFDVCAETFEVVPAPPALLGDVDGGDRMVLAELAGKLCAVNLSASMETMTVWGKNAEGWRREHVVELQQWPEFSPRTTELGVMPMAVDTTDGWILLDTGKALGYYDLRNGTLQTVYSLETHLDHRYGRYLNQEDGVFFIATVCEDSLLRPYDRKSRFW